MRTSTPKDAIRSHAESLGFEAVGFAAATLPAAAGEHLTAFLGEDRHGEMDWMARNAERRADPGVLWPEAKSVVMLGANYGPVHDPRGALLNSSAAAISCYAQNADYHDVLKSRLKQLGGQIAREFACDVKIFVDTAPVMEKPLAQAAGIGWQGKHTNLVSRDFGSWLFIGSVFMTLDIEPDAAETDHCGACRRCLDACPTAAFTAPYRIDARRCISYLTIEHKGHIPEEFRRLMGNRIYGCDDCLAVCPWNKFASVAQEIRFQAREDLGAPDLAGLARLDDDGFRAMFRGSPIKRIGRDRFVRNILIAMGNSGNAEFASEAERLLGDTSPLVRAMAVWALRELLAPQAFATLRGVCAAAETDDRVLAEWRIACAA
jgi:epoxyqueuosine reductase